MRLSRFFCAQQACTKDRPVLAMAVSVIAAETMTCPRHGACFCLNTGQVLKPPAFEDIACFAVRIQDGRVQVYGEPNA